MNSLCIKKWLLWFCLISCQVFSMELDPKDEITALLQKWPQEFNAKNISQTCALFAPDLIAAYPGTPDRNYKDMCQHLRNVLADPERQFIYESPLIEEILLENNLAVVRLIWTLKIMGKNQSSIEIKEKGIDIFKRQKDGSWKIYISYAFPLAEQ